MVNGWHRMCPDCGNDDGKKVKRIAFRPTFECECGYVWDGSSARFIGVFNVADASDAACEAVADLLIGRMEAAARERD